MRMSVNKEDSGHENLDLNSLIFLDGVQQKYCITADEEKGYLLRYKLRDGEIYINRATQEIETEEVYGKVAIERQVEKDPAEAG